MNDAVARQCTAQRLEGTRCDVWGVLWRPPWRDVWTWEVMQRLEPTGLRPEPGAPRWMWTLGHHAVVLTEARGECVTRKQAEAECRAAMERVQ